MQENTIYIQNVYFEHNIFTVFLLEYVNFADNFCIISKFRESQTKLSMFISLIEWLQST